MPRPTNDPAATRHGREPLANDRKHQPLIARADACPGAPPANGPAAASALGYDDVLCTKRELGRTLHEACHFSIVTRPVLLGSAAGIRPTRGQAGADGQG